jgi:hypothetical protein
MDCICEDPKRKSNNEHYLRAIPMLKSLCLIKISRLYREINEIEKYENSLALVQEILKNQEIRFDDKPWIIYRLISFLLECEKIEKARSYLDLIDEVKYKNLAHIKISEYLLRSGMVDKAREEIFHEIKHSDPDIELYFESYRIMKVYNHDEHISRNIEIS